DPLEMREDTSQLGSHKAVHKMQTSIQPGEKFVFDFVVDGKRDLGAVRPNLCEINDAHEGNVSTHGLERILVRRIAVHRQQHSVRLKTEGSAKAEIDCLGRCHSCPCHHQELPPIRLDTGQTCFALGQRLAHV